MRTLLIAAALTTGLFACASEKPAAKAPVAHVAPPIDQAGDENITAAVRRSVGDDNALSPDARSVKIVTQGGKVTLRGAVTSDLEKTTIEAKTKMLAGVTSVDNQLAVK